MNDTTNGISIQVRNHEGEINGTWWVSIDGGIQSWDWIKGTDRQIFAGARQQPWIFFVDTLVLMLQGGGRSFEDIRELKYEEGLMKLIDIDNIPDPGSAGDWCRRMGNLQTGQKGLNGLGEVRDALNRRMMKRDKREAYTLDADAMEITGEKADAYYTYKGNKGYMPMAGFLFELKLCIYDEFREGNTAPAFGQRGFYRECKARMPKGKSIGYYRADSAS